MTFLTIDNNKCTACGVCAKVCPVSLIEMADNRPQAVSYARKACLNCGHCIAVCPTAALSTPKMGPDDCLAADESLSFTPHLIEQLLRSRRSIRTYINKPVEKKSIEAAINVARFSESGRNSQPVQWAVYNNPEKVKEIGAATKAWMEYMAKEQPEKAAPLNLGNIATAWDNGNDLITRSAPSLIVAHGNKDNPMLPTAAALAICYLEFALLSHDIGSCWAGYIHLAALYWPPMKEILDLPEGNTFQGGLLLGYPAVKYPRMPQRNPADIIWK